jgi:hypothetical protein
MLAPSGSLSAEETMRAEYHPKAGCLRFTLTSPRFRDNTPGPVVREYTSKLLRNQEFYPCIAFSSHNCEVRVEETAPPGPPTPQDPELLRNDFSSLLGAEVPYGPVTFAVAGEEIVCDRFLLLMRSTYFATMLRAGMSESRACSDSTPIPIPNASFSAFRAVLVFIYSAGAVGPEIFETADALEVLHLSIEFLLPDLTKLCEWKL